MKNPWTKKNPLLSLWLSAANSVLGSARAHATAAVRREAGKAIAASSAAAAKELRELAAPSRAKPPPGKRPKRKARAKAKAK